MQTRLRHRAPLIIAAGSLAISAAYLIAARQYPAFRNDQPGPGLYPLLVGLFWVAAAVVSAVEVWRETPRAAAEIEWPDRPGWLRVAIVVIACAAYIALVGILGDLVMSFIVLVAVIRAMGLRDLFRLLVLSAVLAVIWHLIFVTGLHVALPQGLWPK